MNRMELHSISSLRNPAFLAPANLPLTPLNFPFNKSLGQRFRTAAKKLMTAATTLLGAASLASSAQAAEIRPATTAPNGQPWIEGDTAHFAPKVNYSLESRALEAAQFAWAVREYARTNGTTSLPTTANFVGIVPTEGMKTIFTKWVNQYRARHGLRPMVYALHPDATFTEQGLADAALYQQALVQSGFNITHHPELVTTAPCFPALTPAITIASQASSICYLSSAAPTLGITQPFDIPLTMLTDTATETGHRHIFLDPNNQFVMFGSVPVDYSSDFLLSKRFPIRFASPNFAALLQTSPAPLGRELNAHEKSIVFPPPGWNLPYWSRSNVPCDPDWPSLSFMSTEYDLVNHRPTITVTEESSGNTIEVAFLATSGGATSAGHQSVTWQRIGSTSFSLNSPNYVSVRLNGLVLKGDASNTPRTVTWRFGYSVYNDVVLETERLGAEYVITFPAAHLYDGWELSGTRNPPPFNPWQVECSRDATFSSLIDPRSVAGSHCYITPDGIVRLSFTLNPPESGEAQIYTRVIRKPGVPYMNNVLQSW